MDRFLNLVVVLATLNGSVSLAAEASPRLPLKGLPIPVQEQETDFREDGVNPRRLRRWI